MARTSRRTGRRIGAGAGQTSNRGCGDRHTMDGCCMARGGGVGGYKMLERGGARNDNPNQAFFLWQVMRQAGFEAPAK